ncbi:hypothetical protein U9M48_043083, partial [Paspalum notatum var. saurae]
MLARGQFPMPQPTPPPPPPRNQPPQRPNGGNNQRFPAINRDVNFILGGHGALASKRQQKLEARRADQWLDFDEPSKYLLLVNPIVGDTQLKKVLINGGANTPFFEIVPGAGEHPLKHIYLSVAFGTAENFCIEMLRFEVPTFNCVYNAIIGRPGLAKFMAIPHYPELVLKMPAP